MTTVRTCRAVCTRGAAITSGRRRPAGQAGREPLALLLCDDQVADSHRALPSRASPTAFSLLIFFVATESYLIPRATFALMSLPLVIQDRVKA
jgi:hypothetical protein